MFAKLNKVQFAIGQLALLVGSSGLEPPTLRLSGVRSNHLSYEPIKHFLSLVRWLGSSSSTPGGDEEDRTPDPLRARQVLSQLSYTPESCGVSERRSSLFFFENPFRTLKTEQHASSNQALTG